jgi:class 3 adenylate cyclase
MLTCAACGTGDQPDAARFCFSCGAGLAATCSACQADLVAGSRFCSSCGAPQGPAAPAPAGLEQPVASRRITSVLFGDLVGFTSLSETRDQEEVRELLSGYFEQCSQVIARYGGTVEKFIGDAVMAVWGVPTVHEDDAERAVRAGLELVSRVETMGADLGVPDLAMRVGIVTGEVAVTVGATQQGMVAGDAVNTAARVQTAASPGQVWVDETTRLLTTSAISYVDVGSHVMKGKADPVPLWAVRAVVAAVGGAQRADGLEAPLIGRDREMRLVKELFHGAEESGRPSLLVIDGEPGVGKSRLGWEFEKYADGLSAPVRWHNGRCLSYGEGVAYFALAEAIRGRLQLLREDATDAIEDEEDQRILLELGLDRYVPDPQERSWLGPRLGALLGTGAVAGYPKEDLFAAWTAFLTRVGEDNHPVVLVIDDAQHADDGLVSFLEYLLGVGTFPCFVLLLARQGLLEAFPALATNRRATVLHLDALSDRDMGGLLDGLVPGLPGDVRDGLVARSEGIPLYAVETVRSLIDRDLVVPRGGQYVLADTGLDLDALGAPASLQALIAARLDTLTPELRRLVDRASVVGNSFTRAEIALLCPELSDLDAALAGLVRLQVLRQESNRFSTELGQYQFVQGAVRQVAYGSIARRDRKAAHLAVAAMLETEDDAGGELSSIIAQHYVEARDAVADADDVAALAVTAVTHLRRAAARASALGSPSEAASHLRAARALCSEEHETALIDVELALELIRSGDEDEGLAHATQARDSLDRLGDALSAARAVVAMAQAMTTRSDLDAARELLEERIGALEGVDGATEVLMHLRRREVAVALRAGDEDLRGAAEHQARLAERLGRPTLIADAYLSMSFHYITRGPFTVGRLLLDAAADIARHNHDTRLLVTILSNLNALTTQDDAERAVAIGRESDEAARRVGDVYWTGAAGLNLMLALLIRGDWDEALALEVDGLLDVRVWTEFVHRVVAFARDDREILASPYEPTQAEVDDPSTACILPMCNAFNAVALGDPSSARLALDALTLMHTRGGIFDDFSTFFVAATEIALATGDRATLAQMVALAVTDEDLAPPTGLRAQLAHVRALVAQADSAAPDEVEKHYRTAVSEAAAWRSAPVLARVQARYAAWLAGQGRHDEAEPIAAEARRELERLRATAWLRELDDAVTGVLS